MPKKTDGYYQRILRRNRERAAGQAEQNLGQCSECERWYPQSKLQDESTQEYYYVICVDCIAKRDPRVRNVSS